MEIKMKYTSGVWEASKDLAIRLAPEQDEKLAKLIEATVARFSKKIEEVVEQPAQEAPDPQPVPAAAPHAPAAQKQNSDAPEIFQPKGYKGMLRITCPQCKETFYKFTWKRLNEVQCNCGNTVELGDLVPAKFYCPNCEKEYAQHTNSTAATIFSTCSTCRYEMTSTWNAKKHRYEPIEE